MTEILLKGRKTLIHPSYRSVKTYHYNQKRVVLSVIRPLDQCFLRAISVVNLFYNTKNDTRHIVTHKRFREDCSFLPLYRRLPTFFVLLCHFKNHDGSQICFNYYVN